MTCESCGAVADVRLVDGSEWCRSCHDAALALGYDREAPVNLAERITALEAELAHERQMHAATVHREETLQRGGARLVERAALADELADHLNGAVQRCYCGSTGPTTCPNCQRACALLARHAATKESANDG